MSRLAGLPALVAGSWKQRNDMEATHLPSRAGFNWAHGHGGVIA